MSSRRRPADDAPSGQPEPKKAKPYVAPLSRFVSKDNIDYDIDKDEAIRAQIAAKKAQLEAQNRASGSATPAKPDSNDIAARLAAIKGKVKASASSSASPNPYLPASSQPAPPPTTKSVKSGAPIHPALLPGGQAEEKDDKKRNRDRYKPMAPKFASVKANASPASAATPPPRPVPVAAIELNPYTSNGAIGGSSTAAGASKEPQEKIVADKRKKRIGGNAQGRYIAQGDELRQEAKLNELRAKIAEAARKAGLDSEFDVLERNLRRQAPPEVEWWDQRLLPADGTYEDIEKAMEELRKPQAEPAINHYVQHPIPVPPPMEARKVEERGLMLTSKEQKKMRKQRRQAELQDKRDRQKMGLIPADPPKVKLANMMKVLTSDAVQDPTKVEARIRKEVAGRLQKHEIDNAKAKLTKEERAAKDYEKRVAREAKGLYATVYKIKYLTDPRHRFKVRKTADFNNLSGVTLFHPNFAMVVVEGEHRGIEHYKGLMTRRIDWTEQARPRGTEDDGPEIAEFLQQQDAPKQDLADNKCEVVWEGEVMERAFKGFRPRYVESDTQAKGSLTAKWEGMFDLAKKWVWEDEGF